MPLAIDKPQYTPEQKRRYVIDQKMMPIETFLLENTDLLDPEAIRECCETPGEMLRTCLYELMDRNVIFIQPQWKWRDYQPHEE